jgi:hypothetical protein
MSALESMRIRQIPCTRNEVDLGMKFAPVRE